MTNKFLVSVANAVGRDANTGAAIFLGKANISSAVTISTSAQEVRGGIGNGLLYVFYHSRKFEVKVDSATFDKQFLGLNVGALTQNGVVTAVQTEDLTLVAGVGTCTLTPTSDISVFLSDNTVQTVTPVGKTFTVVGGAGQAITAVYNYNLTADNITVSLVTPPSVVDLTLTAEERDSTGVVVEYVQIHVPRFQISGNYTLSLAANGVSTQALDGMGLEYTDPVDNSKYAAKIIYIPAAASTVSSASIVAIPSSLLYTVGGGAQSLGVKVLAIRGVSTVDVTTSSSFTVSPGTSLQFSPGLHTGIVLCSASTASAGSASGSMVVTYWDTVNSASRTDWVNLGF
jgi:hypothetical protein